jgi:hypothetical protein
MRGKLRMKARLTPVKAIRWRCLDCMCGNKAEVIRCDDTECSLWEYRLGKTPTKEMVEFADGKPMLAGMGYPQFSLGTKASVSPERIKQLQKAAARARAAKARK